ncbi:MAG: hypothetical protein ACXVPU_08135 [Bacteroidia bacterium]
MKTNYKNLSGTLKGFHRSVSLQWIPEYMIADTEHKTNNYE